MPHDYPDLAPGTGRAARTHPDVATPSLATPGVADLGEAELRRIAQTLPLETLLERAARLRDEGHGDRVSYSRKVFIPLTRLCRDVCHYCTFARAPQRGQAAFLDPDQVLAIARAGQQAGCQEALFTLGDKPELRYRKARAALDALGEASTITYLATMAQRVFRETGLLPHANPGVMSAEELSMLRGCTVSQGIMLESTARRLCDRGGPHFGSPDKDPAARLACIEAAGRLQIPFTSGILIGIGETREERLDALLALRALSRRHGHIQEIIVQNFRAKPATPMAGMSEPDLEDLLWTIGMARLVFGPRMNIQAPPNLTPAEYARLIAAGINDWGGISPVTPDHVNPEAPWPQIDALAEASARAGKLLVERLAIYPDWCAEPARWLAPSMVSAVRGRIDADGLVRTDPWAPGRAMPVPDLGAGRPRGGRPGAGRLDGILRRASSGEPLAVPELLALFAARGAALDEVLAAADSLRDAVSGQTVGYVVNRNINYTNVCAYKCRFCAFSKGRRSAAEAAELRGAPYDLALGEIERRAAEAWERGATEVCMQGGIHPDYTGQTYLEILRAVKSAVPRIHVHAFSPLEVSHGAHSLGLSLEQFLERLQTSGLGSLPGTAAEILDDAVRAIICPDKLRTAEWFAVMAAARRVGLRATATIMYGHVEAPVHWARHLLQLRQMQAEGAIFTEFVPLPFVHMESPLALRDSARPGPTFREAVLMHAVARLALHPLIPNIQASWVKMGPAGALACLGAGANDLGGTLMNESISRAAGTEHGQELPPAAMESLIASAGRQAQQRTTLYAEADAAQAARSYRAAPLAPLVQTPLAPRRRVPVLAGR